MDRIEKRIIEIIDANRDVIIQFGDDIYRHGELGYKEVRTSQKVKEFFEKYLSDIQDGLAITGIKGYLNKEKKDHFSLALIGELDALRIPDHPYVNLETQASHCCGHHAQLAGLVGSLIALSDSEVSQCLDGQVVFLATPSEEYGEVEFKNSLIEQGKIKYGGGKSELIRIGAFDDIDSCIVHHTSMDGVSVGSGSGNGFISKVIKIKGKASHAAHERELGINALYAANLGLQALSYNKDTFKDEDCVRIHPIMTKGGDLVNVVPDNVVIETQVRGKNIKVIEDASEKTDRSFQYGALALGANYRIETVPGYLPSLPYVTPHEVVEIVQEVLGDKPLTIISPNEHTGGSTDVGDVQHLMPVITFKTSGASGGLHQTSFSIDDEDEAYVLTAKIFALGAYRLLKDQAKVAKKAKSEYQPVFATKEEYIQFMNQFSSVQEG